MMAEIEARLEALLNRAIRRVRATEANTAIAAMRAQEGTGNAPAISYEVVLPSSEPVNFLTDSLMPRLVYFLDCAGFKLPRCAGVFLSLFSGEDLFFIRAEDVVDELSKISGMSPAQMVEQFGEHDRQSEVKGGES
jgi:hypothetical protein